jgi:hypothetical protein
LEGIDVHQQRWCQFFYRGCGGAVVREYLSQ